MEDRRSQIVEDIKLWIQFIGFCAVFVLALVGQMFL